jgi:hypothetical protein
MPKEDIVQADQPVQKKKKKRNKKKSEDKKLVTRLTDPCVPITKPQTTIVPHQSEYCYSNSLIAIEGISPNVYDEDEPYEMNFRFKDGQGTQKELHFYEENRVWYEFGPEKAIDLIEICYYEGHRDEFDPEKVYDVIDILYGRWDDPNEENWGKCCGLRLVDTKSKSEVFKD